MSKSEKMKRVPVGEMVEFLVDRQRQHYDQLLAATVARMEARDDLSEETKREIIEDQRIFLAADLERFAMHALAYVAGGMRPPGEAVH
jgi:hypothetical protein